MIAVIKVGGHQAIVQKGDVIRVDRLSGKEGSKITFETLLVSNEDGSGFKAGAPVLKDVAVEAKILEHGRDDKVRVFKMKRRKRYRRTLGHKQDHTVIEITSVGGESAKAAPKKEAAKIAAKPAAKKPAAKKAPAKSTAAKKPAAKKAPAKKTAAKKAA